MMNDRFHVCGFRRILSLILMIRGVTSFSNLPPRPVSFTSTTTSQTISKASPPLIHSSTFTSSQRTLKQPKHQRCVNDFQLHSLSKLIDDVTTTSASSVKKTIFVGGKGGVGKTTVSAALAVELASQFPDLQVLVVSTDPAHSLGDALDEDLRSSHGQARLLTDPLTGGRLSAMEVDASAALEEFRNNLQAFDISRLADALGVSTEMLESFGLQEFSGLLNNPPPGLDELVALSNVLSSDGAAQSKYDVVIVDTAPTGHTLRLLALPQFLDGLLGKLIKLRMKLSGLASTLQAFFGDAQADQRARTIDTAMDRLEAFRTKMSNMRRRLQDSQQTSFVVVTVPTKLSVAESKRLVHELDSQGVTVTDIVVNQCVVEMEQEGDADINHQVLEKYYERRKAGQEKWATRLQEAVDDVSASEEYKTNGADPRPIAITKVPFFDVELVGVPALAYVGRECFLDNPNFEYLMEDTGADEDPKVVICGGKGGVGKTTTSAALAVSMAAKGHNVALISTDPAHSLGDAVDINLAGGKLIDCPLIGVPPTQGSLSVLEVDPTSALSKFKGLVDQLFGTGTKGGANSDIRNTLSDLQEVFDTLPAGTDEVVALATVVNFVKKQGGFDRIVLDTAPTGHTLRMLSTPGFLADLIDRLLMIAQKVNSNAAVRMLIASSGAATGEDMETAATTAKSTLLSFQLQMYDLEDIFYNADQTEFLIVTIPTELAVRESVRLLNDLTFESPDTPIKVRNVVINQVLRDDGGDISTFVSHVRDGQATSIQDLEEMVSKSQNLKPVITRVPFLDTEPRGVFGLKVLAHELLKE